MRLFVGCFPPAEVAARYAALAQAWSGVPGLRVTAPASIHLTLAFLGEHDDEVRTCMERALATQLSGMPAVDLTAVRVGGLPTMRRARVGVVEVAGVGLDRLAVSAGEAMRACGLEPQARAFRAHITLGRLRRPDALPPIELTDGLGWRIARVDLVRSHLGPGGARYEPLASLALG